MRKVYYPRVINRVPAKSPPVTVPSVNKKHPLGKHVKGAFNFTGFDGANGPDGGILEPIVMTNFGPGRYFPGNDGSAIYYSTLTQYAEPTNGVTFVLVFKKTNQYMLGPYFRFHKWACYTSQFSGGVPAFTYSGQPLATAVEVTNVDNPFGTGYQYGLEQENNVQTLIWSHDGVSDYVTPQNHVHCWWNGIKVPLIATSQSIAGPYDGSFRITAGWNTGSDIICVLAAVFDFNIASMPEIAASVGKNPFSLVESRKSDSRDVFFKKYAPRRLCTV